jgi:hypothetical protein
MITDDPNLVPAGVPVLYADGVYHVWEEDGIPPWMIPSIDNLRISAVSSITDEKRRLIDAAVGADSDPANSWREHVYNAAMAAFLLRHAVDAGGVTNISIEMQAQLDVLQSKAIAVAGIDAVATAIATTIATCDDAGVLRGIINNPSVIPPGWPEWTE